MLVVEKSNVYTKEFSNISGIQEKKIIKYYIFEEVLEEIKYYGIIVSEIYGDKRFDDGFCISQYRCKVLDILKFLYENSIGIFEFKDVVEDLLCVQN